MVRISGKQSRIIAFLTMLVFIFWGINLVRQNAKDNQFISGSTADNAPANSEEPTTGFVLNHFRRTETKKGKKLWEITAENGQYFKDSDSAKLSSAVMIFYQENGDVVEVTANKAVLQFDQNILKLAELTDTVKMNVNKERFVTTEKADFYKSNNTLIAPGYAKIEDRKMILEGETLKVNLSDGVLEYERNVRTQIKAIEQASSPL